MELDFEVGDNQQGVGDGSGISPRGGKQGQLIVQDCHGRYHEAVSRGRVWTASIAAAGVAPGTAIGTTPALYLHNPIGSGYNLSVLRTTAGYVSGTLGAGSLVYTTNVGAQAVPPTGGTALTPIASLLGNGAAPAAKPGTGQTVAAQSLYRPTGWIIGASLATTAALPVFLTDLVDGEIEIPPGFGLGIQGIAAAGTTPLMLFSITWEEIRIT